MKALVIIWILFVATAFNAASAIAQTPYYQGKTIRLIQGREPGGSGDTRVKLVAPYLKKYIPGNPVIVVKNMPGAGSAKAATYIALRSMLT